MNDMLLALVGLSTKNPTESLPNPTGSNLAGQATAMFPSSDGQYIYLLGGYGEGSTASRVLMRYTISTKAWTKLADCPRTTSNGSFMYPIAGEINGEIIAWLNTETSRYNIANNTWVSTTGTPANNTVHNLSMGRGVVRDGKLLSFGYGTYYAGGTGIVEYNPVTRVYVRVAAYLPASKLWAYPATALLDDKLYVGGDNDQLSWYDFATGTWSVRTIPFGAYNNFNFAVLNGKLYMMGAGPVNTSVWSYDPVADTFKNELPTKWPISSLNTAIGGPGTIYCLNNEAVGGVSKARFFSYTP